MNNQEMCKYLNDIVTELCPKLKLEFSTDYSQIVHTAFIRVQNSMTVDPREILVHDKKKAHKDLLRARVIDGLMGMKNYIEKELDNLEKGT